MKMVTNMECFIILAVFAFVFGSYIASFLNVCIWRIPREESVVWPPSHCPRCNARIRWYQNIPIISWIILRGRCANCRQPISARYVAVELLGGVLFLFAYIQWASGYFLHISPVFGLYQFTDIWMVPISWLVFSGLILGSFVDFDHYYLPDRVTIGGMVLGVPLSVLVPELQREPTHLASLISSLEGLAFGFLFMWGIGWMFSKFVKREALGFGDVKLMGAIGAFFGPSAVLFTLMASSAIGTLATILLVAKGKARLGGFTAVPYGPFIALGALIWMYWGPVLLDWYLSSLGLHP